jgi:hypothetical protein
MRAPLTALSSMKLIGSHASPFACKARIVLAEKRIDYEFVTTDVHAPDSPGARSTPTWRATPRSCSSAWRSRPPSRRSAAGKRRLSR